MRLPPAARFALTELAKQIEGLDDRIGQFEREIVAEVVEGATNSLRYGRAAEQRWLFPGRKPGKPMTTRQLNRLFHETATRPASRRR